MIGRKTPRNLAHIAVVTVNAATSVSLDISDLIEVTRAEMDTGSASSTTSSVRMVRSIAAAALRRAGSRTRT